MNETADIQAMKALSVRQPYAYAIVIGYKPVENRNWPTSFRGPVLIHAAKKEEKDAVEEVLSEIAYQAGLPLSEVKKDYEANKNLGCIVGITNITDCVTDHPSDWFTGPYGFVLANPRSINPIPCKGALNFFKPKLPTEVQP